MPVSEKEEVSAKKWLENECRIEKRKEGGINLGIQNQALKTTTTTTTTTATTATTFVATASSF